jgi:FkbM family methyltransferase
MVLLGGMLFMQKNLAFDIGCNIGNYTRALLTNKFSKVVSVDPNPFLFMNSNDDRVIRVVEACSDKKSTIPFYFSNSHTVSTASKNWVTNSRFSKQCIWKEYSVPSTTIDDIVSCYGIPDHIKIDVEGYEEQVLKGMSKKYSPEICFEWAEEEGGSALRCVDYLHNLGYTKFGFMLDDTFLKKPEKFYSIDEFKKVFLFVPERKTNWGMIWGL